MKIFNKYFLMTVASCCLLAACGDDDDYKPGAPAEGQGVFFSNAVSSKINLDSKATSFDVQIGRSVAGSAATVELTVEDSSGKFTIPTSVSFTADAEMATLKIGYNPEELEYDAYAKITLAVKDEENTTPYGPSTYTFEVGIPAPWKSIGKAIFSDTFIFENSYQVELQQNENDPTQYRLIDPYSAALKAEEITTNGDQSPYVIFKLLAPGNKLNDVTISNEGLVYFDSYCSGFYNTAENYNKNVDVHHPSDFTKFQSEDTWEYNRVTHYKEDGTPGIIQLAPYYYMDGLGGWDYTQKDGSITIVFPGYVLLDYSASVTHTGTYTSVDGKCYATANVTLGKDVESAKVALVENGDVEAAITGIEDGSLSATEITKDGVVSLPYSNKGTHTFVVVVYGDGKAQGNAYTHFWISTSSSKWTPLGTAEYTDAFVGAAYGAGNETYEVEIEESDDTSGLYRLVNPYGEAFPYNEEGDWDATRNYYLEINASDPDGVYITVQNTGLNWGDGNFYVYSEAASYLDNGKTLAEAKSDGICGTLKDGVITFPASSLLFGFFEIDAEDFYEANTDGAFEIVLPSAVTTNKRNAVISKKSVNKSQVKLAKTPIQKRKVLVTPSKVTLLK